MHPRQFALIIGIVFLALGLSGFVPQWVDAPRAFDPALRLSEGYGRLFGFLPVNFLTNVIHTLIGISGIGSYLMRFTSLPSSINFDRGLFIVTGLLAILGMISATSTLYGFMPLFDHNVWLHGITSLLGAYFGFRMTSRVHIDHSEGLPKGI